MIHSPRRLSTILQNGQEASYIDIPSREASVTPMATRNQRPKTRDDTFSEIYRPSSADTVLKKSRRRSQTNSPDRSSCWKNMRAKLIEIEGYKDTSRPLNTPLRSSDAQKSRKSPTSPPSIGTTNSSETSYSTTDSNSMATIDSDQGYPSNAEESLPPLQLQNKINLLNQNSDTDHNIDANSFDLVVPDTNNSEISPHHFLEDRSELLFSHEHLQIIFNDSCLLLKFTSFLSSYRVSSIPILVYYLDSIKALKAISYSNAIAEALEPIPGFEFTAEPVIRTSNSDLETKSKKAFDILVREDLPAYITHVYAQTVSQSIQRRITGTLPAHLVEASEGLAEVFCMTDPSRPDNPIIFSSEEFHRTTQYGIPYVIGRNCRFLQGPKTNPFSIKRFREKINAGMEHCEVILNYRRDGSPFMNLFMCAPLCDSKGKIRYFIGAQVDVSGLVNECSDFESFKRLVAKVERVRNDSNASLEIEEETKDEFQELSEMLNLQELDTVRRWGGKMHKNSNDNSSENIGGNWPKPRLLINSNSPDSASSAQDFRSPHARYCSKVSGIYDNYLLIRPYPSLHILFASPSLRVPGILQSPFMSKIGGSQRVRDELLRAFADGHGVTAKVKWVSRSDPEGRNRWIHCTPLLGSNGAIGVWMVVIVDDENTNLRKYQKMAPPVDPNFGRTHSKSPTHQITRKNLGILASRSAASIRDESFRNVPDSPFSTVTFDLRGD
ncbi:putative white collar protein [Erysiphe necator]|uniref:Putative white collar protein n=1 Tax=Uncinula necator TaxID=52586 RepID=A0A0B1NZT7_UNCNE|nr:putative white collar protein [Erysiphe necator]